MNVVIGVSSERAGKVAGGGRKVGLAGADNLGLATEVAGCDGWGMRSHPTGWSPSFLGCWGSPPQVTTLAVALLEQPLPKIVAQEGKRLHGAAILVPLPGRGCRAPGSY